MRKNAVFVLAIFTLLSVNTVSNAETAKQNRHPGEVAAAYGVVSRVLPHHSKDFHLKLLHGENGNDAFEVEAANGIVTVRGNSAIALTRGVYFYLREATHSQFTWEGEHIDLPKKLPDFKLHRVTSPYEYRLYYNVCAFGYTTAFWGWKQWQREIDWMALHGINMPLAMVGQEAVWQKVWKRLGLNDKDLDGYFTGPAFLPWNRMGNVDAHAGPLPQDYISKSEELQKKIMNRMRELGMSPVVPGFSGYIPKAAARLYPDSDIIAMKPWAGFPPGDGTYMLTPLSRDFVKIGKMFISEYRKMYGYTHFYLADAFNEMTVPVSKEGRYKELSNFGRAIYNSVTAGDSNGVWVMQGWLFNNDKEFWDKPSVKAFLQDVPDNRMIIIDLSNESFHGWEKLDGFFGKEWIYSIIHNFGGHNQLFGNLPYFAKDPVDMLSNPQHGKLVGFGISPEGIENNEVVYELLTDMGWKDTPVDLEKWIGNYCKSRYGFYPENMRLAWNYLLKSVYSSGMGAPLFLYQRGPELRPYNSGLSSADFDSAVGLFLSCSDSLGRSELYVDDAIEIAAQYAGTSVDSLLNRATSAQAGGNAALRDSSFAKAFRIMKSIDTLLAAHPLYRLKRWIDFARSWGATTAEENYYEENAKLQVTVWGGPYLSEYAAKEWSGLIDGYYLGRWKRFADSLRYGASYDIRNWENKWIDTPSRNLKESTPGHPVQFAKLLVTECKKAIKE
jgi:alpha-N-acetylglucosaminidase